MLEKIMHNVHKRSQVRRPCPCCLIGGPLTRANYMACAIDMRLSQARLHLVGVNTSSTDEI